MNVAGKNKVKYNTSLVLIEKEITQVDKDSNEDIVTISYKIKFIYSARFMEVRYQILPLIYQAKSSKLNVKIEIVFLNLKVSRII